MPYLVQAWQRMRLECARSLFQTFTCSSFVLKIAVSTLYVRKWVWRGVGSNRK